MDNLAKARRSQALLDSIHELIALERDVSGAIDYTFRETPRKVMVPLTPVAFMPGTITSESVMVGLGQEYYVERTPQQAQGVLQRRIADLSREANILASSALLPPPSATPSAIPSSSPSSTQAKPKPKQAPSRPDKKGAWTKGFLTTTQDKPVRGGASPKETQHATTVQPGAADDRPKQTPFEMKSTASGDREHTVVLEDGEEDPIMEIKEWLDDSGKQTSVDVTDLGKVMRKAPEGVAEPQQAKQSREQEIGSTDSSPAKVVSDGTGLSGPSDLDSIFARLEQEEASAQEETRKDSSLSLGPKWKKGFLSGGTKRGATPKPTAKTAHVEETKPATLGRASPTGDGGAVPSSQTAPTPRISNSHAFEGSVVEKAVNASVTPTLATTGSSQPTAAMPPRVSRFKARRQGLQ